MKPCTTFLLGLLLVLALSATVFAHFGDTRFFPQVPDPSAVKIDGKDDDWGWLDKSFAVTGDMMEDLETGKSFTKDDWDVAYFGAWSAPPDNQFYFFIRVTDDTLRVAAEDPKVWWTDDAVQITFDADHSGGGSFLGDNIDQVAIAQRYHLRILPLAGQPVAFNSLIEYIDLPQIAWSSFEPWFNIAWTVLPAGAKNQTLNVTYTFEFKCALWDIYGINGPDESKRHVFAPDQVIHVGVRPHEGDREQTDRTFIRNTSSARGDQIESQMTDWIAIPTEAGPTAVEQATWGRIKGHLEGQLGR